MYFYKLSIEAENDVIRIYEYGFHKFGMIQADEYYEALYECFNKIALNPFMFPSAELVKSGFRYCVCGVDTIYYVINQNNIVEIITIIGRQDFPK